MNLFKYNKLSLVSAVFFCILVINSTALFSAEPVSVNIRNGSIAELYTPESLEEYITYGPNGFATLSLPSGEIYRLITDINDPSIVNKGDGEFHPFDLDLVLEALNGIDLDGKRLDIRTRVYILPFPVSGYLCSFVSNGAIYLSPGVNEIDGYVTSYVVAHEFGHVFQLRYLPLDDEEGWDEYLALRGMAGIGSTDDTGHPGKPVEVFAEDFRYLFGNDEARYSNSIENETLIPPDEVPGLREFFVSLVGDVEVAGRSTLAPFKVSNYPNPFNPSTTIIAEFDDGGTPIENDITLKIFSVDGRLVKSMQSGRVDGNRVSFAWDGTNERGVRVTSGTYFYSISAGRERTVGKMILIR